MYTKEKGSARALLITHWFLADVFYSNCRHWSLIVLIQSTCYATDLLIISFLKSQTAAKKLECTFPLYFIISSKPSCIKNSGSLPAIPLVALYLGFSLLYSPKIADEALWWRKEKMFYVLVLRFHFQIFIFLSTKFSQ